VQSLSSLLHVVRQAVPPALHMNGAQLIMPVWLQFPMPLQDDGG
jgi:hypothetical protein